MKWIFFLCFSIFFCCKGAASTNIDSLKLLLNSSGKDKKAGILNELSWELKFSDPASADEYGQTALRFAKENEDQPQEAKALYQLGVINSIRSEYVLSNKYSEQAVKVYKTLDDASGIGRCLNLQGINEQNMANYEMALSHYSKALEIFELFEDTAYCLKIKGNIGNVSYLRGDYMTAVQAYEDLVEFGRKNRDTVALADNLANTGRCFSSSGRYDKALQVFFEAVELFRAIDNKHGLANTCNDMGILFYIIRMYPESLAKHRESLVLYHEIGNELELALIYNNIGRVYSALENYDSALLYFNKGLVLYEENDIKRKGELLTNIGEIKYKQGEKKEAEALFEKALEIDISLESRRSIALHKSWLGLLALDESNFSLSEKLLLEAHEEWSRMENNNGLLTTTKHLSNLYKAKGEYKSALKFKAENEALKDSIFNQQQQNELARVIARQQLKEKEQQLKSLEIDQLKLEQSSNHVLSIWQLISLGFIIFLALISFSWFRLAKSREKLQARLQVQVQDLKTLESEKEGLANALERKHQEVVFLSLSTIQKDNFIKQFSKKLKEVTDQYPQHKSLQKLSSLLYFNEVQQQDWARFKAAFEQISPGFFDSLFQVCPNLSNKELRHCALIRLKFSSKDIAKILGISVAGVHKARYRLRKQLNLSRDQNLESFLTSI